MAKSIEQGGYYALKGFSYQLDKAILDVFESTDNGYIFIEQVQDLATDDYVTQVKYRETQKYSHLKIREPVLQLYEEWLHHPNKIYKLYCHFSDRTGGLCELQLSELKEVLVLIEGDSRKAEALNERLSRIDSGKLELFLENFELVFAPNFQEQFDKVIVHIGSNLPENADNNYKILCYSWIYHYVNLLVINSCNPNERRICRDDILGLVKEGRQIVFDAEYLDFLGAHEYLKSIKKNFVPLIKTSQNFVVLGEIYIHESMSLVCMIKSLLVEYFKSAKYNILPFTLIVFDDQCLEIKKGLSDAGIVFNDGYEEISFNSELFWCQPIVTKKQIGKQGKATESLADISFQLRVISESKFREIVDESSVSDMTLYLGSNSSIIKNAPYQALDRVSTLDVLSIVRFR